MKNEIGHTPTPWFADIGPKNEQPAAGLVAKHPTKPNMKMSIGILFEGYHAGEAQANAAFIVRAVNAHEELLQVAKRFHKDCDAGPNQCGMCGLIARAEGE